MPKLKIEKQKDTFSLDIEVCKEIRKLAESTNQKKSQIVNKILRSALFGK
jgi:hypothetical protein